MNRYSCIFNQMWKDKKFRQLDDSGQKLFIALISSPSSNMIGYYNWPLVYALHDLNGWHEDKFRKYMSILEQYGMAFYDYNTEIVFIPNYMKYNSVNTIKQIVGAFNEIKGLPSSCLFQRLYEVWSNRIEAPYLSNMHEKLKDYENDSDKKTSCQKSIATMMKISEEMAHIKDTPIEAISIPLSVVTIEENPEKTGGGAYTPIESISIPLSNDNFEAENTPIDRGIDKQVQVQVQEQVHNKDMSHPADTTAGNKQLDIPQEFGLLPVGLAPVEPPGQKLLPYSEAFEEFWKSFPRYERTSNKQQSFKLYQRLLSGKNATGIVPTEDGMLLAVQKYKAECRSTKRSHQLCETWLGPNNHWATWYGETNDLLLSNQPRSSPQRSQKNMPLDEYMANFTGDDPLGIADILGGEET